MKLTSRFVCLAMAMLIAVFAVSAAFAEDAAKIQYKYNLKKGDAYDIKSSTAQQISQTVMGMQMDMTQEMGFDYTYVVSDVDNSGNYVISVKYTRVKFSSKAQGQEVSYDSAKDKEPPAAAATMAALVGQGFTMTMTPAGAITDIKGLDQMVDAIVKAALKTSPASEKTLKEQMQKQFGDAAMKRQMEQMMGIFPDKPVGAGETWTKKVSVTTPFPMDINTDYKVTERKDGVSTLAITSKISTPADAKEVEMSGMKMKVTISGTQEGTSKLDEATGLQTSTTLTQKLSGEISMKNPQTGEDMKIPMSIDSKSTIEMTKAATPK